MSLLHQTFASLITPAAGCPLNSRCASIEGMPVMMSSLTEHSKVPVSIVLSSRVIVLVASYPCSLSIL